MIPKKEIVAFYVCDTKGRHKYELYTGNRSVIGEFYLKKAEEIPEKLIISLKIKDTKP